MGNVWSVKSSCGSAEIPWARCFLGSRMVRLLRLTACPGFHNEKTLWYLSRCDWSCWISSSFCFSIVLRSRIWSSFLFRTICNSCIVPMLSARFRSSLCSHLQPPLSEWWIRKASSVFFVARFNHNSSSSKNKALHSSFPSVPSPHRKFKHVLCFKKKKNQ